ncbi:threonine aldolase family protein [Anaeromyxobacter oryzae]|uniref:L-threonine aldolase n=1 Tax=Anaeromyxobacter oryzae TaxID=2918170 RepID=A0ABN6MYP3_9BACT|nr:low specificity L-threonine aldolase [Anaeromyxobacter oryzae]BDG04678.1 L-threonine aldolase [Anaeromyxobacter oryzae]
MTRRADPLRHFASDNYAGICPEAWAALAEANVGHAPGYGDDRWTAEAADLLRETFETDCDVFFAFNGTAANSLALAALCQSYHSILCHETAHVETDECGAPEFFSNGTKVLTVPGPHGKLDPAAIDHMVRRRSDIHYPKPRVVSVTQPTELGTVYRLDELRAIRDRARAHGLKVHMDGARFGNAVAALGCRPRELTWEVGVDVLCFGGTKAGMAVGEAVVFFDRALASEFEYRCKQAGQLASKMRFLAAPWVGMLRGGAWLRHAANANEMARLLERLLREVPEVKVLHPVDANAVFATLPPAAAAALRVRGWRFYDFIGAGGARFMCAWDTTEEDVAAFVDALKAAVREGR